MSEHQCYEFLALDEPLDDKQMSEVRAISSRAEVTPRRCWAEYRWGDLKADPAKLLERYFDVHIYQASWSATRLMFRLPARRVDLRTLGRYFPGQSATLTTVGKHVVLDISSSAEESNDHWVDLARFALLPPLRASLLQGDMSAAYLAWLLAVQEEAVEESENEPPVPAGLRTRGDSLDAMIAFLQIDPDLVTAAAEASAEVDVTPSRLHAWVKALSPAHKDHWLQQAVDHPEQAIGAELVAAYRREQPSAPTTVRTAGGLLEQAEQVRAARMRRESRRAAAAAARARAAREKHLDALTREGNEAWRRLDKLVSEQDYDAAVPLTVDLRDAAVRSDSQADFEARYGKLRKRYPHRRAYLSKVKHRLSLA